MTEEQIRETVTIQPDGRMTMPDIIRKKVDIYGKKPSAKLQTTGRTRCC